MDKIEEIPVSQFHEINKLLLAYSAGNYNVKGRISANRDAIDTIILAVNMLGEEIVARTVSRDYFSSIYNAIKDLVIVCDSKGIIKDNNNAVIELLGEIKGKKFSSIIDKAHYPVWKSMQKHLAKGHKKYTVEINFSLFNSKINPFSCSFSKIFSGNNKFSGYLVIAEDLAERKLNEERMLSAIAIAQDNERNRISRDLHDNLNQELIGVKSYLQSLEINISKKEVQNEREKLSVTIGTLSEISETIKEISFNLMPRALVRYSFQEALSQLLNKLNKYGIIKLELKEKGDRYQFPINISTSLYRIIQEFISNTMKHANAKNISILLHYKTNSTLLVIKDDGKGFDTTNTPDKFSGNGLKNIAFRVKTIGATHQIKSIRGKGTELCVWLQEKQPS